MWGSAVHHEFFVGWEICLLRLHQKSFHDVRLGVEILLDEFATSSLLALTSLLVLAWGIPSVSLPVAGLAARIADHVLLRVDAAPSAELSSVSAEGTSLCGVVALVLGATLASTEIPTTTTASTAVDTESREERGQ